MKFKILLLLISSVFSLHIMGQTIRIIDKSDLKPINNVFVYNSKKTISVYSDKEGKVDISSFDGNDSIYLRHTSFQQMSSTKSELTKLGTIYLLDNIIKLDEFTISVNKSNEKLSEVPNKVELITAKQIAFVSPQTSGDLLQQTGSVFVQQSQMGGGSPIIRGFEANKVLLVVDGVRMNNAIYRSGHLQNIITLDPNMLENVEVVFGPGSVIYGSDALGGVMNFQTKIPTLREKFGVNRSDLLRYSSANNEKTINIVFDYGSKKWAGITSFTYKDFGDLKTGSVHNKDYPNFGYCGFYAERYEGKDSMMINSDSTVQKYTGYSQYDVLQKILFKPNNKMNFVLNAQLSNSSNINRYDRLTEKTGTKPSYAEWYYGPQMRSLISLTANIEKSTSFYDKGSLIVAMQNISEDRINRKFNSTSKTHQEETVNVYSMNVDFQKQLPKNNQLYYGLEFLYNDVQSIAYKENIVTQLITYNTATRYPDGGSTYLTSAAYLSNVFTINPKLKFSQGIRFSNVQLNSSYTDTMLKITKFPFDNSIKQQNSAFNGSLGLVYLPGYDWKLSSTLSSGFRAPNVDDISKVNDSKAANKQLIIPNLNLKSEYAYNLDVTLSKTFMKKYQIEGTFFYTLLQDAIAIRNTTLNGLDSVVFDGKTCQVQTNMNVGEAEIYGFQAAIKAQILKSFSLSSSLSYTHGIVKNDNTPLDHVAPLYGITSIKYEIKKFKAEFYSRYNGSKKLEDYSLSGEDNLVYATADGMPSWFTLNLRTSYQIHEKLNVQLGIENLMDVHYRYFASGVSAPGRNIVVSLRSNF